MSAVEADLPAPIEDAAPAAAASPVRFVGAQRSYWRLLIRGGVLLIFTLGIYRFWLSTDMRRFLWSSTQIGGESLEYTGTAFELLIGFLIAIVILVPINALLFAAALDLGLIGQFAGIIGFVVLAFLGHIAVYRARRYRLTRTVLRGVRCQQTGNAWRYAIRATLWWGLIALSLGLAYPFAQASLERYKMGHTFYGDLPGRFVGSGWRLFLWGFPMWLLVMGPLVAALIAPLAMVDWNAIADIIAQGGDDALARIEGTSPGFYAAIVFALLALGFAFVAAALLYPVFQAMMLRWWCSGLRFGKIVATSRLRVGQVYGAYLQFLWYAFLFAVATGLLGGIAYGAIQASTQHISATALTEVITTIAAVCGYVVVMLGYSTIYQATVRFGLWRLAAETLEIDGIEAIEHVTAVGGPSSAIGEGLADALHVGGF